MLLLIRKLGNIPKIKDILQKQGVVGQLAQLALSNNTYMSSVISGCYEAIACILGIVYYSVVYYIIV